MWEAMKYFSDKKNVFQCDRFAWPNKSINKYGDYTFKPFLHVLSPLQTMSPPVLDSLLHPCSESQICSVHILSAEKPNNGSFFSKHPCSVSLKAKKQRTRARLDSLKLLLKLFAFWQIKCSFTFFCYPYLLSLPIFIASKYSLSFTTRLHKSTGTSCPCHIFQGQSVLCL